jgi:hypothetical protein
MTKSPRIPIKPQQQTTNQKFYSSQQQAAIAHLNSQHPTNTSHDQTLIDSSYGQPNATQGPLKSIIMKPSKYNVNAESVERIPVQQYLQQQHNQNQIVITRTGKPKKKKAQNVVDYLNKNMKDGQN